MKEGIFCFGTERRPIRPSGNRQEQSSLWAHQGCEEQGGMLDYQR